jgi:Polyketide cyclase / dehydrase and lipid transport
MGSMVHSSTRQSFIDAPVERVWQLVGDPNRHPEWWPEMIEVECADLREGCLYRGVVKGFFGADEHEMLIERLEDCHEVTISCDGTGVTTRFLLAEARGGTFVEGSFGIEPNSIGMKVFGALAGRRLMRTWLESSLENLKETAERSARQPA